MRLLRRAGAALLIAALAAAVYALWRSGLWQKMKSLEDVREMIAATGYWGGAVYFLLMLLSTILAPIPSNVTMLAGAMALGFWPALLIGVAAVTAGSVLVFLAARRLGRNAVKRKVDSGVFNKYLPVIDEKKDMFLFLAMLFPFFPDDILCILAGVTSMPLSRFTAIIAIARPWGLAFAALAGSGATRMPLWGFVLIAAAMIAISIPLMRRSREIEDWLLGKIRRLRPGKRRGGERESREADA